MWRIALVCAVCCLLPLHIQGYLGEVVKQNLTFNDAERYCAARGGHLPSIHDHSKNQRILNMCQRANEHCWIGMVIVGSLNVWTDGSKANFTNFAQGQPDNKYSSQHCGMMGVHGTFTGGVWADQSCEHDHAYFICQFPHNSGGHTPTTPTTAGNHSPYKLYVEGSHLMMNGQRVFISGANQAWVSYAYDFGNNQYQYRRSKYEQTLREISQAGGNSVRVWVHIEGETSPQFDSSGHVTGLDRDGTFISDMREYLQAARKYNVLVFFTLWNAAVKQSYHYRLDGLITDTDKLQSYIDHALIPMVTALKNETALGGWDIMNEPEGELKPDIQNSDPCFDTVALHNSGAGWAGKLYTAQQFARFLNWQADAIRRADPEAMVTVGAWSEKSDTDNFGFHNLYSDDCLRKAGGKQDGTLTFYSIHTYDWNHQYNTDAPFKVDAAAYGLDKPIMIAEFNQGRGGGMTIEQQFDWAYTRGYCGALTWSETDGEWDIQRRGMTSIKDRNDPTKGGLVHINLN